MQEALVLGALRDAWSVALWTWSACEPARRQPVCAHVVAPGDGAGAAGCILSLVTLVARQIAKPLQQLARVADEVRKSGDHTLRAQWNSRDEIGRLVTAFNEMLSQLDRDRLLQQELAASAPRPRPSASWWRPSHPHGGHVHPRA